MVIKRESPSSETQPKQIERDWLSIFEASWKPVAAIAVPVAVVLAPAFYKYYTFDRGVDSIIIEQALAILQSSNSDPLGQPTTEPQRQVRDWAILVVERYSGVNFSEEAKADLRETSSAISQTATNPEPLTTTEIASAINSAKAAGSDFILSDALSEVGVKEFSDGNNPRIIEYNQSVDFGATDDETPWNSQFLGWIVQKAGYPVVTGPGSGLSRIWENWGQDSEVLVGEWVVGCIMVAWRQSQNSPLGLAGIYLGDRDENSVRILGGNFFNAVDVITIPKEQVLSCRLPDDYQPIAQ